MRRELKRLRTYLGRVYRDVDRKIAGDGERQARFDRLLGLVERLLAQQPKDNNKLYSLHAPDVVRIAKGKAHKPYEFGCKVGIAATNREGLFLAASAFEGNPYDGHILRATLEQAEAMSGVAIKRAYADKGYRGHDDYQGPARIILSGQRWGLTPQMKRELKRRSAIEPMIGHAKNDGRLGKNHVLGHHGDRIDALLAASGHNLRLILNTLALLLARILAALLGPLQNLILGRDFPASKIQSLSRFSGPTKERQTRRYQIRQDGGNLPRVHRNHIVRLWFRHLST